MKAASMSSWIRLQPSIAAAFLAFVCPAVGTHFTVAPNPASAGAADVPQNITSATSEDASQVPAGTPPHFSTGTYSMLRSSGDRVSSTIQRMMGVQGSLDDLREDLSTEYLRWKAKEKTHLDKRAKLEREIKNHEAKLLAQKSQLEKAGRLRGDLALAKHADVEQNKTHAKMREGWQKKQEALQREIGGLLTDINDTQQTSLWMVAATHNRTDELRHNFTFAQEQALQANATVEEFQEARANHSTNAMRAQSEMLQQLASFQKQKETVMAALRAQHKLQWEHDRLAVQAKEVVRHREEVHATIVDCDAKVQKLNEQMAEVIENHEVGAVKLRECQLLQAENEKLQEKANQCRAASRSVSAEEVVGAPMPAAFG